MASAPVDQDVDEQVPVRRIQLRSHRQAGNSAHQRLCVRQLRSNNSIKRALLVDGNRIVNFCVESPMREMRDQLGTVLMTNDERAVSGDGALWNGGELEEWVQRLLVGGSVMLPGRDPVIEMRQLDQQNRRLKCVQPRVFACDIDVIAVAMPK